MSTSNPLWSLFLESSCSSASVFFKLHLSARSYFHSPTPWINPNSTIPRKVSRLLDSFKPGSSSYCPFPNVEDSIPDVTSPQTQEGNQESNTQLLRPSDVPNILPSTDNIDIQESTNDTSENQDRAASSEEEMRRRLYLNLGRPRPFYRVSSAAASPSSSAEIQSPRFSEQNSVFQENNPINRQKVSIITITTRYERSFRFRFFHNLNNIHMIGR